MRISRNQKQRRLQSGGFTLVEALTVLGIIAVMFSFIVINLGQSQSTVSVSTTVDSLLADLKSQQLLAMAGENGSGSVAQPHGIYIQSGSYTLFANSTYPTGDSNNFAISMPQTITLSTTFPSTQVVFAKGSGEVTNGGNTITVTGIGSSKTITINRFGAITVN